MPGEGGGNPERAQRSVARMGAGNRIRVNGHENRRNGDARAVHILCTDRCTVAGLTQRTPATVTKGLTRLGQQGVDVEGRVHHRQIAVCVVRPIGSVTVAIKLDPVAVGIAEIDRL